jgi:hypothetical protein
MFTESGGTHPEPDPEIADCPAEPAEDAAGPDEGGDDGEEWTNQVVAALLARMDAARDRHGEMTGDRAIDCKAIEACAEGIARLVTPDPAALLTGGSECYRTIPTPAGTRRKVARFIAAMADAGAAAARREAAR